MAVIFRDILFYLYTGLSWISFIYGLNFCFLLYKSVKPQKARLWNDSGRPLASLPFVTIQLPVYNELYVVERLIRSIRLQRYPKDRFQLQILDDSDDETAPICVSLVDELRREGYQVDYCRRLNREGYKGGALRHGLSSARGDFVAIFDADFVPDPDFLRRVLPYFADEGVGMVQTRWSHLNEEYSPLTRALSLSLDAQFLIEQAARNRSGYFLNFNGTAGVWRRRCIIDSGGWNGALAEDLDLSLRAYMRGWRFVFLPEVTNPAELPVQMNAARRQQFRWAKGSMECALQYATKIFKEKFSLGTKVQLFLQLTRHSIYPISLIQLILLPWLMRLGFEVGTAGSLLTSLLLGPPVYIYSLRRMYGRRWVEKLPNYFFLLLFGSGISVNNARAFLSAFLRRRGEFFRTPKYGIVRKSGEWRSKRYTLRLPTLVTILEFVFAAYAASTFFIALIGRNFLILPHIALLALGLTYVAGTTILHSVRLAGDDPRVAA